MFATNLRTLMKFANQLCKSPKSLKRYACSCFCNFMGRLLELSGRPQAGFAQNVSLQKSLKRYACACFGDSHCDPLGDLAVSASSPKSLMPVHVSVISLGGSWSPLGVLRQVSLRTSHCKSCLNVMPVDVCYEFTQIDEIR